MIISKLMGGVKELGISGCFKTIIFNLKYFPFRVAIKFPVLLTGKVKVRNCKRGLIQFNSSGGIKRGLLVLGKIDREYTYDKPLLLNILGRLVINGSGFHHIAPGGIVYIGPDAVMEIGDNFSVSHDIKFYIRTALKIGDNNMWSYYNVVMDNDGHPIFDEEGEIINSNKGIIVGNNVWLGCRCTILKGANIPDGSIIGTNSIVRKSLPGTQAIYGGTDLKLLKNNVTWKRELL